MTHENHTPDPRTRGKAAIVILADPENGDEALGRVVNGLATAYDHQEQGDEVQILFQGTGTRWIGPLQAEDHPAHGLYALVKDRVAGLSSLCVDVFGGGKDAELAGHAILTENAVPGTSGLPSLRRLRDEGYTVLTF